MMVENLIEHEDGSATIQLNMSAEETRLLIETAVRIGLMKGLLMEEAELGERMKESGYERTDAAKRVTEWVGLTKQEIRTLLESSDWTTVPASLIWKAEDLLKEKNT